MSKEYLRFIIKKKRDDLAKETQAKYNNQIYDYLIKSNYFINSKKIYIFASFASEVDTFKIMERVLTLNKELYLPKIDKSKMNFYKIDNLSRLNKTKFGYLEPDDSYELDFNQYDINEKSLMLVPGLVFDKEGNRIGYGGGYYDRFLNNYKEYFYKIGLAFDIQIINKIKTQDHDIKLDDILSNKGFIINKNI